MAKANAPIDFKEMFGEFTPNASINASIHACLLRLPTAVAVRAGKRIKHDAAGTDKRAPEHTYRELIIGIYLTEAGYSVEYERKVEGKTPDWAILDGGSPACLLDVFTLHPGKDNEKRAIDKIDEKAGSYASTVRKLGIPFVVVMYGAFDLGFYDDEVQDLSKTTGITADRRTLSGVLYVEDAHYFLKGSGVLHTRYLFHYFPNASADVSIKIPGGHWFREPSHKGRKDLLDTPAF